jgi:hypothetical protein
MQSAQIRTTLLIKEFYELDAIGDGGVIEELERIVARPPSPNRATTQRSIILDLVRRS